MQIEMKMVDGYEEKYSVWLLHNTPLKEDSFYCICHSGQIQ